MAIGRVVQPEILDRLAPDDPEAIRSRADLRLINLLMGNPAWLLKALRPGGPVVEIGAGEGDLCRKMHRRFPDFPVFAVDFVRRPENLPAAIQWRSGDLHTELPGIPADTVVGVMILHHFSEDQLKAIGVQFRRFRTVTFVEPWRSRWSLFLGYLLWPIVGSVTRHDMPVSILAGFLPGELGVLLGMHENEWQIRESVDWRGGLRFQAWKK